MLLSLHRCGVSETTIIIGGKYKCMMECYMWVVLFVSVILQVNVAFGEIQSRSMFYSFMSYKAGLEIKVEINGNIICFKREDKFCSLMDLQINAWRKRHGNYMFSKTKDMKTSFIFGQPHGPAQILLEDGKVVFTQLHFGKVVGMVRIFDSLGLSQVSMSVRGFIEKTWKFDEVGLATVAYSDEKGQLLLFRFEENVFAVGKSDSDDQYYRVNLQRKFLDGGFLVPRFDIVTDSPVMKANTDKWAENDI